MSNSLFLTLPLAILFGMTAIVLFVWWRHARLHTLAARKVREDFPESLEAVTCGVVVAGKKAPGVAALLPDRILVLQPSKDKTAMHAAFDCFQIDNTNETVNSAGLSPINFSAGEVQFGILLPPDTAERWMRHIEKHGQVDQA